MEYKIQFGTLNAKRDSGKTGKKFRIAVLGDFSGKGNSKRVEIGETLAARKPLVVHHENMDSILSRLDVRLNLPAGQSGAMVEVPIKSMEDFHPDQLYSNVPLFEKLVGLRQRLQDPATFAKASAAVLSLAAASELVPIAPVGRKSSSNSVPRGRIESFSDLIQAETQSYEPPELKTLLRDVVGSHVVPEMHGQAELIAAVDESLSDLMRRLLHHPDFQAMESLWRSLDFLVHRIELDHELEVVLYDINAAELAADLASSDSLEETGLFSWLVEAPSLDASQGPLSMLLCNFVFEHIPPHAELLARAAKIAAAAGAPFITAVDCSFLKKTDPSEVHPLVKESWDALRQLPEAAYLALTTPRFMLRWPYGKKTEPIESFKFEEFTPKSGLSGMLWGNSAFLAGLLIGQTFRDDGLSGMKLGSILTVDDIPFYFYTDVYGDQVALPCTERLVNLRIAQHVTSQGLIPTLAMQGSSDVRLGGLNSLAGVPLAGPWAPLSITGDSPLPPMRAQPSSPTPTATPQPTEPSANSTGEPAASSTAEPAASSTAEPAASSTAEPAASSTADDELDNLLSSLDAPAEATSSDSDMDAELAAMLADL